MVYNLGFFSLQNAVCFIILTYFVPVLSTFYIQGVLELKNNNSGAKRFIIKIILRNARRNNEENQPALFLYKVNTVCYIITE